MLQQQPAATTRRQLVAPAFPARPERRGRGHRWTRHGRDQRLGSHRRAGASGDQPFPRGAALRVKPILVFDVPTRGDRTSWRGYGAIQTPEAAREEAGRIEKELSQLQQKAEFPIQVQPVELLDSQAKLAQMAVDDTDLCIVYAAGAVGAVAAEESRW